MKKAMQLSLFYGSSLIFFFALSTQVSAGIIDPQKYILNNGYQSVKMGDDGKTLFYSFTERAKSSRIRTLQVEIERLPKHIEVQRVCDSMRGSVKATLIEKMGIAIDVAVTNYGYKGSTIACILKYMHANQVGTQLIYSKKGPGGMYMVFVTD